MIRKITSLKLWRNPAGKDWAASITDLNLDVLLVSQFTLYARCNKGAKPDFSRAMGTEDARVFFDAFVAEFRGVVGDARVKIGEFGAMMQVDIVNEGPVTVTLDSQNKKDF
jgi:D-tyrosyl-tRNA(Tyr) deacylase